MREQPPPPPPFQPDLDAITYIEHDGQSIIDGRRRFVFWDRSLWWRTYRPGRFDGYRTLRGRRLPCATLEQALRRHDMKAEIRRLAQRRP